MRAVVDTAQRRHRNRPGRWAAKSEAPAQTRGGRETKQIVIPIIAHRGWWAE